MTLISRTTRIALALIASSIMPGSIQAQTAPPAGEAAPTIAGEEPTAFGDTVAIDPAGLGQVTGREDVGAMIASATQRNTVSNNSVTGTSTTGNVQIAGNAFQNLQGLAVISANSGNNVAMNAAMNVTVNLTPR